MKVLDDKFFEKERERLKVEKREKIRKLVKLHHNNKRLKNKKREYKKKFRSLKRTEKNIYRNFFNEIINGNPVY